LGATRGMKIASARPVEDGKQVEVEFEDKSAYRFHASWMKDSSPNAWGSDYYRKSARTVFDVESYIATEARIVDDGSKLVLEFRNGSASEASDEYVSTWLHAFAPYVGRPLHEAEQVSKPSGLRGTGSLLDDLHRNRKPWRADVEMPRFSAQELRSSEDKQIEFLERMVDPGIALITDVGPPESLENEVVGKPLEDFVSQILGRLNQHPVRSTRYGVMHTHTGPAGPSNADYDHSNPLSMHTDHSPYNGTPGYIQFMYQAQGTVESKVCDGLALANSFKEMHPEAFELLTTVHVTHSSRNRIYSKNGTYSAEEAKLEKSESSEPFTFELVHTHPVIELNAEGNLEKIVQSETKRGVCALPFDKYEKFMAAYKLWTEHVENLDFVKRFPWPEHSMVVCNNYRVLHGRATVPPNIHRTMVFGYIQRTIFENRYRLLRQRATERANPEMTDKWTTRLPNQVLSKLVL